MQSQPTVAPGQNGGGYGTSQWHPTVLWMGGFIIAELVVFHVLSRALKI